MPKNPFIYYGLLLIVGTAAVYAGSWLTQRIEFVLPFTLGVGILLVILGAMMESRKKKKLAEGEEPANKES